MIFLAIVIGAVAIFFILIALYLLDKDTCDFGAGLILGMVISISVVAEIFIIYGISEEPEPKAIDVYRNKTELEITSVNGVPRDTIVVWKGGIEK
jgi:hypothetical protein